MEENLERFRIRLKPKLWEYLNYVGVKNFPPKLTYCPNCGAGCHVDERTQWHCDECGAGGDTVDYAMRMEGFTTTQDAIHNLIKVLNVKDDQLEYYTASQIMDMQFKNSTYIVENLIGVGLGIIAGPTKIGKSWLAMWLASQVSKGGSVWGHKTNKGTVLYLCLEDTLERVQSRLVELTGGESNDKLILSVESKNVGDGLEDQILKCYYDNRDLKLVIIDTLQKVRGAESDNGNAYGKDYGFLTHLKNLADKLKIGIVAIHHTRKLEASDPFDRVSGTTAINGCVDWSFVMEKNDRMADSAILYGTGRDIADFKINLKRNSDRFIWEIDNEATEEAVELPKLSQYHNLFMIIKDITSRNEAWFGTATELLEEIKEAGDMGDRSPNSLGRILNSNSELLYKDYGVIYSTTRSSNSRIISLGIRKDEDLPEEPNTFVDDGYSFEERDLFTA